jgi:glucarate dehydratase
VKIRDLILTPLALDDPPLLNATGVHEPLALRCVLRLVVDGDVVGLGECGGEKWLLDNLAAVREYLIGMSVFETTSIGLLVEDLLSHAPSINHRRATASAIEVACLDAQGKLLGLPVCDLLGGRVRDSVPYSAYLFYKWAGHPERPGFPDAWGEALDPAGIVEQARRMIGRYGFRSIKLKGGVFPPEQEIAAIRALHEEFPGCPLRIDPNCAWTPETSMYVAKELDGILEYLEDPTPGVYGMAAVARVATMPLATNMCVINFQTVEPAAERGAVDVVLSDHHYWGGLRRTRELGAVCEALGLGLSMHSNSHLGISLAAMTHVAAATPNLTYACDTHYPWTAADDVLVEPLEFVDGSVAVPAGPGLGIELDEGKLAERHAVFAASGRTIRDDTGYLRRFVPSFDPQLPRW